MSVGFLSTYPPTQCGLATFTRSLAGHLVGAGTRAGVVRVVDAPETVPAAERGVPVTHHLVRDSHGAAAAAAALDRFDVAVVQHEFGIFGGADGDEVVEVVDRLRIPVIVVAHTVLTTPTPHQREVFDRVIRRADAVVTMSVTARDRLCAVYDIDPGKVIVIPHGSLPTTYVAAEPERVGPPTILTWGLLGPGKGIESVIDAMPALQALDRKPRYQVVGQTHPKVLARDGEAYRHGLMARAADRGVGGQVTFHGNYLDVAALNRVVARADVVVLPYESREQVTSGVLIEAVASGRPVVATAFPHAVELLASGSGLVVPHDDPAALTEALRRILVEPGLAASMSRRSTSVAPQLRWSAVAERYRALAAALIHGTPIHSSLIESAVTGPPDLVSSNAALVV